MGSYSYVEPRLKQFMPAGVEVPLSYIDWFANTTYRYSTSAVRLQLPLPLALGVGIRRSRHR